jgi:ferredoxin-NADP reductase/nitrite reductase/ring-hydroxylating ferredoxin subunit
MMAADIVNAAAREAAWYPIAASDELLFRHVYHGQLFGQELAVWRADDGNVNAWENRCLHRGVRLSIGINEGPKLKCHYPGGLYANRTAGCTYIPAHPADAPARRITNRAHRVVEAGGLVWSTLAPDTPFADQLADGDLLALRPIPVNATPEMVLTALMHARRPGSAVEALPPLGAALELAALPALPARFFIQPVDAARAVIRGIVARPDGDVLPLLHSFDDVLEALRDEIEAEAARVELPEPIGPVYQPVSVELATMPPITIGAQNTLRVVVKRKFPAGADIVGLELAALEGHLPTFQPGAHIDLHLPNGLVRQYSLTNGPGEQLSYIIGVKREATPGSGSHAVHEVLRVGDTVAISEPRNNFPLRRDAKKTWLIAGGIGITPLLAMAKALKAQGLAYGFELFARSEAHVPFPDDVANLGSAVHKHLGLDPEATAAAIGRIVATPGFAEQIYVCGPGPFLELVRAEAAVAGWPESAVHFEYFKNTKPRDTSKSFKVELARSALTLEVPAGKSILAVLRDNGVNGPASCEQGACGTCLTRVLDGEIDHQDVYLNEAEKREGKVMLTCVSRALSGRLVLDI